MGLSEYGPDGPMLPGRPRPYYTYSRKSSFKKLRGQQFGLDFTDDDDDDSNLQPVSGQELLFQNNFLLCLSWLFLE